MSKIAINSQIFDFTCTSEKIARQVQQEIEDNLAPELNNIIMKVIEEMVKEDEFLKIDKIELDLGEMRLPELRERELQDRIAAQFTHSLRQMQHQQAEAVFKPSAFKSTKISSPATRAADYELLIAFCRQGDLPWWADKPATSTLDALIRRLMEQDPINFKNWLMQECLQPAVLFRLSAQCKPATKTLLAALMPELAPVFAGAGWVHKFGLQPITSLFSPSQAAKLQGLLVQNQYWASAPYTLLLDKLTSISDWSELEQTNFFDKFSLAELALLKAFVGQENKASRRIRARIAKLLKRLTIVEVEFLLFLIAREENVLTRKIPEGARQANGPAGEFRSDTGLIENYAGPSAAPLMKPFSTPSASADPEIKAASAQPNTNIVSEISNPATAAPSHPGNKPELSATLNYPVAPSQALKSFTPSLEDASGSQSASLTPDTEGQRNSDISPMEMPAFASGSIAEDPARPPVLPDNADTSIPNNSDSNRTVMVLPNKLSPGLSENKGATFLGATSIKEGAVPEKSNSGNFIPSTEPERQGEDPYSNMQKSPALGLPENDGTLVRKKLSKEDESLKGNEAESKGFPNPSALDTPEELKYSVNENSLDLLDNPKTVKQDKFLAVEFYPERVVRDHSKKVGSTRHSNQIVNFIFKKLPFLSPVLVEQLSHWKQSDWLFLKDAWAKHRHPNSEDRELIKRIIAHPALLKYNLLGVIAGLSFAETPQSLSEQAWTRQSESASNAALQKLIKNLQAAHSLFLLALGKWSLQEKIIMQDILQKKQIDTPGEEKILRRILNRLPTECLLVLQFLTELPEPALKQLGTAEEPLTTFPEQSSQLFEIYQDKAAPSGKVYLENAGLCLIALYLPSLFSQLGYLENKKFKNKYLASRALYLTQYLVTGKSGSPEYLLPLNKLFCGFELTDWVASGIRLTKKETTEAADLLQAVIGHWQALKNTTITGFREGFLQRKGILLAQEAYWTLQVERKGHDLLLNTLPWGYNMIKLPWMNKMLQVEW